MTGEIERTIASACSGRVKDLAYVRFASHCGEDSETKRWRASRSSPETSWPGTTSGSLA
jgi:hypothetical protein